MNKLQHACAFARAEVEYFRALVIRCVFKRSHMPARKVHNVYIVAYARAVRRGVIVAKHAQFLAYARGGLGDIGHKVIGNAVGLFAYKAAFVRAYGVEIS